MILVLSVSDSVYLCLCRCHLIYRFPRLHTYFILWLLPYKSYLTSWKFPFVHIFFNNNIITYNNRFQYYGKRLLYVTFYA